MNRSMMERPPQSANEENRVYKFTAHIPPAAIAAVCDHHCPSAPPHAQDMRMLTAAPFAMNALGG
ncbi:hypothetical protein QYL93_29685 [Acidovorax sp. A1169]|nr:hypothetical protein [Acidovorax sp. A1169]